MTSPAKTAAFVTWHRQRAEHVRAGGHLLDAERHEAIADVGAEVLRAEGRCQRCGRRLSDPASVAREIGPECARQQPSELV